MYEKFLYNSRKIKSARKLSGCIQKEQSKVILVLATNNSTLKFFEKTVTGCISCVNTHLLFGNINA